MKQIRNYWQQLDPKKRRILKPAFGIVIGAVLGYTYYATVGCASGTCPITGNPVISTFWGAAIGGFAAAG